MSTSDPRAHLLWALVRENLERGRAADTALAGARSVSYGALATAASEGARQIDDAVPAGSRLLVAGRDQQRIALAIAASLASQSIPLLADPTSPERLRRLAAEWNVAAGIGERAVLAEAGLPLLDEASIDAWLPEAAAAPADFTPPAVSAATPAFWTFTSGTTGEPKAVVHAHRGPKAAYEAFARGVLQLGPEDVTIATAGLPFVYALGNNLFFPLLAGATAILPSDLLLPTVLGELARHGATVLVAGPWSLSGIVRLARRPRWIDAIRRLRLVLSAGEPLPAALFTQWERAFGKEVLDNLGCTEMFNSFISSLPGQARAGSLGAVVPGFEIRIGGAQPTHRARGELVVRGESRAVAVGAAGKLTRPSGEWCSTGDEVEVDEQGEIRFLGRTDDRFKVKGRFLYPLEIERVLAAVPGVVECLAVAELDENGLAILAAKIVPAANAPTDLTARVLRHARTRLDAHAIPARIDLVESLPRSARGKLLRPPPAA